MIVIAGGGLAAQRCCERLRRRGYDGRITMVCDEPHAPYDRPPLSKEYLAGKMTAPPRLRPDGWHRDHDVELILDMPAKALHPERSEIELADRTCLPYEQLLVATGATPRSIPGIDAHVLRTLADSQRLRDSLGPGTRLAVIGAGFIGQEVAATARSLGAEVTLFEVMPAPLAHIVGEHIGGWFTRLHLEEGVDVRVNTTVEPPRLREFDQVVVGIGVDPATEWLRGTAIGPNGKASITADHSGRTCIPNVFAAGDCTGRQHWEAAAAQGANAALAMLGETPPPSPPSAFWSDLYGTRVNWLGDARGANSIEVEGDTDTRDFSVIYRRNGRPVAGLLVGRPQALAQLRKELQ